VGQRVQTKNNIPRRAAFANLFLTVTLAPTLAIAQAASPFSTGANSLVSFALTIATPIAVLIVIALAIAAAVGKISWGWVIAAIIGIACIFGAQQIVTWIRSLFGV
jgi:type IV secretion system protein VirB2